MKIENGYDRTLNEVRNLIHEVESIKEQNKDGLSLKEQKDIVLVAARSFQKELRPLSSASEA